MIHKGTRCILFCQMQTRKNKHKRDSSFKGRLGSSCWRIYKFCSVALLALLGVPLSAGGVKAGAATAHATFTTTRPALIANVANRKVNSKCSAKMEKSMAIMLPRGGVSSTFKASACLMDASMSAAIVSFTLWLVLAWNILGQSQTKSTTILQEMSNKLRQHRKEKINSFKAHLLPLAILLVVACLRTQSFPWQEEIWKHGPSALAVGLNFGYWAAEIVMDTALDECAELQNLRPTLVLSMVVQLLLIVVLTTKTTIKTTTIGHMIFWLKATETLLATALAKLMDHPLWIGVAVLASGFISAMATRGRLAPLPPQVAAAGALSYFMVTVVASTAYQLVQNKAAAIPSMGNVKLVRAGLACLAMVFFETPSSWVLFDSINFTVFFGIKIVTDTIAILAMQDFNH